MLLRKALALVLVLGTAQAHAALWTGILDTTRATDWTAPGTAGGIVNRTTQCGSTISAYTGTAATINTAITNCTAGQFVKLGAGTFTLSTMISLKATVTLRGSGANQTFIKFTSAGHGGCNGLGASVCATMSDSSWSAISGSQGNTANWTAGYSQGTTVITLSSTTNLAVGKLIILDQTDDTSDDGTIYNCQTSGVCSDQGTDVGRTGRGQHETKIVTNIAGGNVTVSPPIINPNWRSGQSPGAWWSSSAQPISGVGIEDLSLDYTSVGTNATYGMQFMGAVNSWVKGVRSIKANNAHINFYQSQSITVRDSYFYGNQGACSQAYSMEPWLSDNLLVENNIFQHEASPMVLSGSVGSVMAYNYSLDDYFNCGDTAWMQGSSYHHEQGSNYHLWEGNIGINLTADNIHGPSQMGTAFRNRWDGKDPLNSLNKTEQTVPINIYSFNRFFNIIGNVLGYASYHTTYQVNTTTSGAQNGGANCDVTIYRLGWGGNCDNAQNNGDPTLKNTLMRWGNYDVVSAAVRWCGNSGSTGWSTTCSSTSEVPSGIGTYANAVPAAETLPASFYLSSKPAWFGSIPWPPIGPDVTGGSVSGYGGHINKIPAQVCFEGMSDDGGYTAGTVRVFDPATCYAASLPAPRNPRWRPHPRKRHRGSRKWLHLH